MNEIEKMYENAGIMRRRKCEFYEECPLGFSHSCDDCDIEYRESNSSYPPFTAEKQIELIKWLAFRDSITITANKAEANAYNIGYNKYCSSESLLKDCLARLINKFWLSLNSEEKQQIKEILT